MSDDAALVLPLLRRHRDHLGSLIAIQRQLLAEGDAGPPWFSREAAIEEHLQEWALLNAAIARRIA